MPPADAPAAKADLKKLVPGYIAQHGQFELVGLEPRRYLMIDGSGDPNTATPYADALATLYPVAYTLKFFSKKQLGLDYIVPPLEALWWAEDMTTFTTARDKSAWHWTVMSLVPEWLSDAQCADAMAVVARKGTAPLLDALRLEELDEGLCVQTLHIGSYDDEAPVLQRMHEQFIPEQGLQMTGRHHEIYLNDPRRIAPEKLKTILRQPVARLR